MSSSAAERKFLSFLLNQLPKVGLFGVGTGISDHDQLHELSFTVFDMLTLLHRQLRLGGVFTDLLFPKICDYLIPHFLRRLVSEFGQRHIFASRLAPSGISNHLLVSELDFRSSFQVSPAKSLLSQSDKTLKNFRGLFRVLKHQLDIQWSIFLDYLQQSSMQKVYKIKTTDIFDMLEVRRKHLSIVFKSLIQILFLLYFSLTTYK